MAFMHELTFDVFYSWFLAETYVFKIICFNQETNTKLG